MKTMIAKYNGKCAMCGGSIRRGEEIGYERGEGAFHPACLHNADEDRRAGEERGEDCERSWPPSPTVLRSDRALGRRGLIVTRFSSGAVVTQNAKGRCEDAPCCGCCS